MSTSQQKSYSLSQESEDILKNPEKKAKIDAFKNSKKKKLGSEITKQLAQQIFDDKELSQVREEEKKLRREKREAIKERDALEVTIEQKQQRLDQLNADLAGKSILTFEEQELQRERLKEFDDQKRYDLNNNPKNIEDENYLSPEFFREVKSFSEKVKRTNEYIELPSGAKIPSVKVQNLILHNTFAPGNYESSSNRLLAGEKSNEVDEVRKDVIDWYEEENGILEYEHNGVIYYHNQQKIEDILAEMPGNSSYERKVALLCIAQHSMYGNKRGKKSEDGDGRRYLSLQKMRKERKFDTNFTSSSTGSLLLVGE